MDKIAGWIETSLSRLRSVRPDLHWLMVGIVASVVGGIIVITIYSPSSGETTTCNGPRINFPGEGQPVLEVVEVVGRFECLREGRSLWIIVTPPAGSPHGIHRAVVDAKKRTFSSTAVLSSGPGEYEICMALADKDAEQGFQAAIEQDPPVGLAMLPPTAGLVSCRITVLR